MYSLEHYEHIIDAFEGLLSKLDKLCLHIQDDLKNYPAVISNDQEGFMLNHNRVIYALKHFEPNLDLSPQSTESFPGAVGCVKKTILLIDAVNKAKDALKRSAETYRTVFKANPTRPIREILMKNGFGPLNLKQVYRHIHYVDYHPIRIAWTKVKAYTNVIISPEQAREALFKVGQGKHINIQLNKLSQLSPDTKLVRRRSIKPCSAVNVSSIDEAGEKRYQKITTSLPIFYLLDKKQALPDICFSVKASRGEGSVRSDKKVENEPFLKSISVYRYQDDIVQ